jgi:hypothetical protein
VREDLVLTTLSLGQNVVHPPTTAKLDTARDMMSIYKRDGELQGRRGASEYYTTGEYGKQRSNLHHRRAGVTDAGVAKCYWLAPQDLGGFVAHMPN